MEEKPSDMEASSQYIEKNRHRQQKRGGPLT